MSSPLSGKVIAITGAASGIGLALAHRLARAGAKLSLADITPEPLNDALAAVKKSLASSTPDPLATVVDVSSDVAVNNWIETTTKHFGRLDGAANLAGVEGKKGVFTSFEDIRNEEWDFVLKVNLTGTMYCMRAEIKAMSTAAGGAGGSIVNASSLSGVMGRPGLGSYVASKHGVVGITRTAAKEVGVKGIRVNCVAPGPIETPMLDRLLADSTQGGGGKGVTATYSNLPLGRKGSADEVAKTITFLLSEDSSYMTGTVTSVDGGAAA